MRLNIEGKEKVRDMSGQYQTGIKETDPLPRVVFLAGSEKPLKQHLRSFIPKTRYPISQVSTVYFFHIAKLEKTRYFVA